MSAAPRFVRFHYPSPPSNQDHKPVWINAAMVTDFTRTVGQVGETAIWLLGGTQEGNRIVVTETPEQVAALLSGEAVTQ